jgi:hypothetical protein
MKKDVVQTFRSAVMAEDKDFSVAALLRNDSGECRTSVLRILRVPSNRLIYSAALLQENHNGSGYAAVPGGIRMNIIRLE